jgi:uncharacterized repeat protein (TIGR01451 family)
LDELRRQCQDLGERISQEEQLGLTPEQIATLVEVIWPHLHEIRLTQAGELRKKDELRLRSWLGDGRLCHRAVVQANQEQSWGLDPGQLRALASAALPHARAILHARPGSFPLARLQDLIAHYRNDSSLVGPLLALADRGSISPPGQWVTYLKQVSIVEYDMTPQQAAEFVSAVWPHILRCLHRYHYATRLLTWIYHLVDHYQVDGETWDRLRRVPQPMVENLLSDCLSSQEPSNRQWAKRLQTLGHKAGLTPGVLGTIQYVADHACRFLAQDPARLALQAWTDISAGLPGFCFGSQLTTWIYQVMLNSRKKVLEDLGREPVPLPTFEDEDGALVEWEPPAPGPEPDEATESQELVHLLRQEIQRACQRMRNRPIPRWKKEWIGRLRFVEGEEHQAISEITGVKVNTVMTIVARIKPYLMDAPWLADYAPVLTAAVDRLDQDRQGVLEPDRPAWPGEALNYRVTVASTGQADANGVRLEAAIPPGTRISEGSLDTHPPGTPPARHDEAEQAIVWQGGLKAGQQIDIVYTLHLVPHRSPAELLVHRVQVRLGRQGVTTAELTTPLALE